MNEYDPTKYEESNKEDAKHNKKIIEELLPRLSAIINRLEENIPQKANIKIYELIKSHNVEKDEQKRNEIIEQLIPIFCQILERSEGLDEEFLELFHNLDEKGRKTITNHVDMKLSVIKCVDILIEQPNTTTNASVLAKLFNIEIEED